MVHALAAANAWMVVPACHPEPSSRSGPWGASARAGDPDCSAEHAVHTDPKAAGQAFGWWPAMAAPPHPHTLTSNWPGRPRPQRSRIRRAVPARADQRRHPALLWGLDVAGGGARLCRLRGLAVSNGLLRRDDQIGCALFWPIDQLEHHRATRRAEPAAGTSCSSRNEAITTTDQPRPRPVTEVLYVQDCPHNQETLASPRSTGPRDAAGGVVD